jgi:hypothetical protein
MNTVHAVAINLTKRAIYIMTLMTVVIKCSEHIYIMTGGCNSKKTYKLITSYNLRSIDADATTRLPLSIAGRQSAGCVDVRMA